MMCYVTSKDVDGAVDMADTLLLLLCIIIISYMRLGEEVDVLLLSLD